jgi:hypothetical protein
MVESRWFRRAGPGILAISTAAIVASTTLGAPERPWQPEVCAGPPRVGVPTDGAWYSLEPVIEAGARTAQRLSVGEPGLAQPRTLALDPESFAAGPFGGTILVGTDDGRRSQLSLVDVGAGCSWPVGTSADVVRRATLAPDGTTLFEFRVDRATRDDLGVWRRSLKGGGGAVRVLAPLGADARFGPTWLTDFTWSDDGTALAIQSCAEVACRFRVLPLAGGPVRTVSDERLGDIVGLTGDRLVAHGACRGLPCPLLVTDLEGRSVMTLHLAAGQAVLLRDRDGRSVVVHEVGAGGERLQEVGLDGRNPRAVTGDHDGRRLVPGPGRSGGAVEHGPDTLVFGPDGRLPMDGAAATILRRFPDGTSVPFDEVSR